MTAEQPPPGLGHCQVVKIPTADGPRAIRVASAAPMPPEAAAALGQLVDAVQRIHAEDHPHAGVIQELMLAWSQLRIQPGLLGAQGHVGDVKDRMSAAIRAVRQALEAVGPTSADAGDRPASGVGSYSEAIALAQGDAYAGHEWFDSTFEIGTAAVMAVRDAELDRLRAELARDREHTQRALVELLRGGQTGTDRCRAAIAILTTGDDTAVERALQSTRGDQ